MKKKFDINFLRIIALIAMLAGAIGSLFFMFNAGHKQNSVILITLFTMWVLSPFAGLLMTDRISRRGKVLSRLTLYGLIFVITLGSLICYSGVLGQLGAKAAFKFLVVPFISWLIIVTVILTAGRMSTRKAA
jgi:hypothetical protein